MAEAEITADAEDGSRRPLVQGDGRDIEKEIVKNARARESSKEEIVKSIVDAGLHGIFTCFSLIASISATQGSSDSNMFKFGGACALSALALALLGVAKAKNAGQNSARSVASILFNGAFSAAAAYSLGWILRNVAEHED